ncbi:hypothetical protein NXC12_PE00334 (plasmid) [Rhizobium etli]|uniref:Uncharacterized protein n=1 Tax=Rhizobium etli TaxID=29449 RepID=A0AAN1BMI5_RHIET|nr:hypothetical protein REMIM1_PF00716 [Rhizobium etli bv. mimosae str. Mim1]ARQ13929.1 hypothetical protein NXC12_PE00334 [Rhizobium etli]
MDDALAMRNGHVANQMIIEIDFKQMRLRRGLWDLQIASYAAYEANIANNPQL